MMTNLYHGSNAHYCNSLGENSKRGVSKMFSSVTTSVANMVNANLRSLKVNILKVQILIRKYNFWLGWDVLVYYFLFSHHSCSLMIFFLILCFRKFKWVYKETLKCRQQKAKIEVEERRIKRKKKMHQRHTQRIGMKLEHTLQPELVTIMWLAAMGKGRSARSAPQFTMSTEGKLANHSGKNCVTYSISFFPIQPIGRAGPTWNQFIVAGD